MHKGGPNGTQYPIRGVGYSPVPPGVGKSLPPLSSLPLSHPLLANLTGILTFKCRSLHEAVWRLLHLLVLRDVGPRYASDHGHRGISSFFFPSCFDLLSFLFLLCPSTFILLFFFLFWYSFSHVYQASAVRVWSWDFITDHSLFLDTIWQLCDCNPLRYSSYLLLHF